MFGIQGILGSIFVPVFRYVMSSSDSELVKGISIKSLPSPGLIFAVAAISVGIATLSALFSGIPIYLCAKHEADEHFHDFTYWFNDDGISYAIENERESVETSLTFIHVKETNKDIKMKHAYL